MKPGIFFCLLLALNVFACQAQSNNNKDSDMRSAAKAFLQGLDQQQKSKTQFAFDDEERYHWNFVPMERKGIPLKELTDQQHNAAMSLLRSALSQAGYEKTRAIIELEVVLKEVENRGPDDHYRDSGKYYFSVFGEPSKDSVWGWRLEGHHVAFNFSSDEKGLVSGTPGFLGANPAVVLSGAQKGKEVLKDETRLGFELLHSLNKDQKEKAVINIKAPSEIITSNKRRALIETAQGVLYSELNPEQQKRLVQLLGLYLNRYKPSLANKMMKEAEAAGLNQLRFAWAGDEQPGVGHPHYYRIQGPTIIIEYDNTQNNANHVHTAIRDLKNDFGGDQLLQHYQHSKH